MVSLKEVLALAEILNRTVIVPDVRKHSLEKDKSIPWRLPFGDVSAAPYCTFRPQSYRLCVWCSFLQYLVLPSTGLSPGRRKISARPGVRYMLCVYSTCDVQLPYACLH